MNEQKGKKIYFITGASGVGKTTLFCHLKEKYSNMGWPFLNFDSIGVPSLGEMNKEFGSPSGWQRTKTFEWINTLRSEYNSEKIFIEGQVNLKFIQEGFEMHKFKDYLIILIECSEEVMGYRLIYERRQPELFNEDMKNWLKFLRCQAMEMGASVIETSNASKEEVVLKFKELVDL